MKHFRILEKKDINKEYTVQYQKELFFGLSYWKNANNTKYYKYDEAFSEVKKIIKQDDYDNLQYGYHYVDAYKIFKPTKETPKIKSNEENIIINQNIQPPPRSVNKSVFVPKQ